MCLDSFVQLSILKKLYILMFISVVGRMLPTSQHQEKKMSTL